MAEGDYIDFLENRALSWVEICGDLGPQHNAFHVQKLEESRSQVVRYLYFNFCIFPAFVVLVGFANFTQCAICRSIVAGCCRSLKPMRILQSGMGKIVLICRFIICSALFEVKGCLSRWMKCANTADYRNGLASKLHTFSAME